jgi:hypothetical protein
MLLTEAARATQQALAELADARLWRNPSLSGKGVLEEQARLSLQVSWL